MRIHFFVLASLFFFLNAHAEVRFEKRKIRLGPQTLIVEIADTDELRGQGLMFREKLEPNRGMLFVFDDVDVRTFWMKNTLIPLAIGFFDQDRKLVEIIEMKPDVAGVLQPRTYKTKSKAKFALEVSAGWFKKFKIRPGVHFHFADKKEHR